mgnify:CR=1 FL=1
MSTTKKAKVLRDFRDAGTEREFKSGATVELTDGEFINYEAGGLVEAASTAAKTADEGKKA